MKDINKWTKTKTLLIVLDCILCIAIVVSSMVVVIDRSRMKNGAVYTGKTDKNTSDIQSGDEFKGTTSARLMFAGDNLIHRSIFKQANQRAGGDGYDFKFSYEPVKDIISKADLAFIEQESVMDPESEPSSYPDFNSPPELLDDLIYCGFDVFNHANDHVLDMGVSGARNCLELYKSKGDKAILTGLYETHEKIFEPQITVVNNIIFSFVSFTETLNGNSLSSASGLGLMYLTDERSTTDELYASIKQAIQNAQKVSDVVCVCVNWEDNGSNEPVSSQRLIVEKLLEYGADIIVCTGTQALQPIEFRENADGEQAAVIWSLGNFISCFDEATALLGGIADVTVKKNFDNNTVIIDSARLIPTVTHYGPEYENVRIIPLADYTAELAQAHGINGITEEFTLGYIKSFYSDLFGDRLEVKPN